MLMPYSITPAESLAEDHVLHRRFGGLAAALVEAGERVAREAQELQPEHHQEQVVRADHHEDADGRAEEQEVVLADADLPLAPVAEHEEHHRDQRPDGEELEEAREAVDHDHAEHGCAPARSTARTRGTP
jgi:hypothetical protein